jgi:hypothetical protein
MSIDAAQVVRTATGLGNRPFDSVTSISKARRADEILAGGVSHRLRVVREASPGRGGTTKAAWIPLAAHRLLQDCEPSLGEPCCPSPWPRPICPSITTSSSAPRTVGESSYQNGNRACMLISEASFSNWTELPSAAEESQITSICLSACVRRTVLPMWCAMSKPTPRLEFTVKSVTTRSLGRKAMADSLSAHSLQHRCANTSRIRKRTIGSGAFRRSIWNSSVGAWWSSTSGICGERDHSLCWVIGRTTGARRASEKLAGGVSHRIATHSRTSSGRSGTQANFPEVPPLPGLTGFRIGNRWLTPPANVLAALRASYVGERTATFELRVPAS